MSETTELLAEIAACPLVGAALAGGHPCSKVVGAQQATFGELRQVPEPWNGHIDTAPLLFVSSNPSISETERYPTATWSDAHRPPERGAWAEGHLAGFFNGRFDHGTDAPWILNGTSTLQRHGNYSKRVTFLSHVKGRAREMFGDALGRAVIPGVDYCITEIVHCKSKEEIGVGAAAATCTGRYLKRILALSPATVIVVLGATAAEIIRGYIGASEAETPDYAVIDTNLAGRTRTVLFFPHPSSFKPRKLDQVAEEDRARLRAALLNAR